MTLSIHLPSEHSIGKLLFGGSHTCSPKCQHAGILGQLERKSYLFFCTLGFFWCSCKSWRCQFFVEFLSKGDGFVFGWERKGKQYA